MPLITDSIFSLIIFLYMIITSCLGAGVGPMPLITDSLFSLIIFLYVMITFLYLFYGFCWSEPSKLSDKEKLEMGKQVSSAEAP